MISSLSFTFFATTNLRAPAQPPGASSSSLYTFASAPIKMSASCPYAAAHASSTACVAVSSPRTSRMARMRHVPTIG